MNHQAQTLHNITLQFLLYFLYKKAAFVTIRQFFQKHIISNPKLLNTTVLNVF